MRLILTYFLYFLFILFIIEGILRFSVTNWTRPSKSDVCEISGETTFLSFKRLVQSAVLKPTECEFSIYFLPEPYNFISRQKIDTIEELRCKVQDVLADETLKSGIYVNASATSPDQAPPEEDSVSSSLSSNSQSSSRGSQQHCFSSRVLKRDEEMCVFCGHTNIDNLEAAHIIDVSPGNNVTDLNALLESFSLLTLYDTENGITLCKTCHKVFDADLCCVCSDNSITVAEAIFSCGDNKFITHWEALQGKQIKLPVGRYYLKAPNSAALAYRKARFEECGERRSRLRVEKPFICKLCGVRTKTARGLVSHMGSNKCLEKQGKGRHFNLLHTSTKSPSKGTRVGSSGSNTAACLFNTPSK